MGLRVSAALWSILSLFKISTVASLFPSRAVESSSSLERKLCGLGTPFQGPWTAALKQEALGDGLIVFRSLNKCLLGRLPHSCVCLGTITSWAEQPIQLRLYKGQGRRGAGKTGVLWFYKRKSTSSIISNDNNSYWIPCVIAYANEWKSDNSSWS